MHRLFLLRAYGDFVILLQALLESPQKNKYSLIASKHLQPLYQELALVIDLSSIQIQFIDFGITNTQLSLFTNKHLLSLDTLTELKQIKNFVKQNPNTDGTDYIEQDKRIGLFNAITGLSFNSIISTEPVYISYAKFFENSAINKEVSKEEGRVENKAENLKNKESETLNNKLNSKKVLLFPDTRQAKKNIPSSLINKLENEIASKGYTLEIAYFKQVPEIATTINEKGPSAKNNKVVYANFKTLIQYIQDAELILGADSLPIHIAYLLKKPHYILYPNGYPQLFMTPYAQINNRFGTFDHYNFSFL
jgi:Glycosyltransferase family 9 (heptosyltransferase)